MKQLTMQVNAAAALTPEALDNYQRTLQPEIERLRASRQMGYQTNYASLQLPFDTQGLDLVYAAVVKKQQLAPAALIVIGIGGSSLGTKAVHEAVHGLYYNEKNMRIKLYFVETVDTQAVADVRCLAEELLKRGQSIVVNCISKSGSTTETIANYEIFVELLKKYHPDDWSRYSVVTTDQGSLLWQLAEQQGCTRLAIPVSVGGRYSVFSAVGLFPLVLAGVDVAALLSGAQSMVIRCMHESLADNPAALSAAILAEQYHNALRIHDMFLFSVELAAVGGWYRQLMAESLGKVSSHGEPVGITPTVSLGSTDLHSVGQLYLGGPRTMCTTFVTVERTKTDCMVPNYTEFEHLVAHIQGKSVGSLMDAIVRGVLRAYDEKCLPYMLFQLHEKTPYYIGQFLQLKMIEIMYLGYLLHVNPFDQPHVENYKVETRKILADE